MINKIKEVEQEHIFYNNIFYPFCIQKGNLI